MKTFTHEDETDRDSITKTLDNLIMNYGRAVEAAYRRRAAEAGGEIVNADWDRLRRELLYEEL